MAPPPPQQAASEHNFRAQLSQFRWARGTNDDSPPAATSANAGGGNIFSRAYNTVSTTASGYVPLRSSDRSNEEEAYFALGRWERLVGFIMCLLGAAACFSIAFFIHLPFFALRPSKFAVSISLGSLLVMLGFVILIGPVNQFKHLFSKERLPFSVAYLSSLGLTLYFSLGNASYFGAIISAVIQIVCLASYVAAYFPGGVQTLKFGAQMAMRGAGSLLPI